MDYVNKRIWVGVLCMMLGLVITANGVQVKITCSKSGLVNGQKLYALHYPTKIVPKASEVVLKNSKKSRFVFQNDSCTVDVAPGTYQFVVIFKKSEDTVVALTTGKQKIAANKTLKLEAQIAKPVKLLFKNKAIPIVKCQFRVPGTMAISEVKSRSPKAILSPGQKMRARIIGKMEGRVPIHAAVWMDVDALNPNVEISSGWHSVCKFKHLGSVGQARNAEATFFMPEARRNAKNYEKCYNGENKDDLLTVPMNAKTVFITNRKFVEMWYTYTTSAGEYLSFVRQPYLLTPKHTFEWGGALKLTAHARFMMTWVKGYCALTWGTHLLNAKGHRVNTPWSAPGQPGDSNFPKPAAIAWKEKLMRSDGKPLVMGKLSKKGGGERTDSDAFKLEEYLKGGRIPGLKFAGKGGIKGVNADCSDLFKIEVSYKLNGKKVKKVVYCDPWVRYKSTHNDFEAPLGMNAHAMAWSDRIERTWYYGSAYPKRKKLNAITTRWTGCRYQGYSVGGNHNHVQLGMTTFRRRSSIYGSDWGPAHEYMHSWGYPHGNAHNTQIRRVRGYYRDHHIYIADHPEYEPQPMTILKAGKKMTIEQLVKDL